MTTKARPSGAGPHNRQDVPMTPDEALADYRHAEHASAQAIAAAKLAEWRSLQSLVDAAGSQQAAADLLGTTQQAVQKRLAKLRREAAPDS